MKWGITVANVSDFSKPTEKISLPQQFGGSLRACLRALPLLLPLAYPLARVSAGVRRCALPRTHAAARCRLR
jgi:hypothetical protein